MDETGHIVLSDTCSRQSFIPSRKFNALQLLFYSFESRIVKFGLGKMNRKIIVGAHIDGIDIFFHSSPRVFEINGIRCN